MHFSDDLFCTLGEECLKVVSESKSPGSREYRSMGNAIGIESKCRGSIGLSDQCTMQPRETKASQPGDEQGFDDRFERVRIGMPHRIPIVGRRHGKVAVGGSVKRQFPSVEVFEYLLGGIGSISH
jgi:hypothetical protein